MAGDHRGQSSIEEDPEHGRMERGITYSKAFTMAGWVTVLLRWSTKVLRASPADVVRSCSKVQGV
jgi:hypothetical protein